MVACPCKTWFAWRDPYHIFELFCPACGTTFRPIRMREPFGYCILPQGPCDVFGSEETRIDNLSDSDRQRLYEIWEEFKQLLKDSSQDDFIPVLLIKDIQHFRIQLPEARREKLTTFIATRAIDDREGIPIVCNCTFMSLFLPETGKEMKRMTCWACGSVIKLLGLTGDSGYVFGRIERKARLFDVQASRAIPAWRLSDRERNEILIDHERTSNQREKAKNLDPDQ